MNDKCLERIASALEIIADKMEAKPVKIITYDAGDLSKENYDEVIDKMRKELRYRG
jgi:hypothetical protein